MKFCGLLLATAIAAVLSVAVSADPATTTEATKAADDWVGWESKSGKVFKGKSSGSKDDWGKPEQVRISRSCVLAELALLVHTFLSHARVCLHSIIKC